MAAGMNKPPGAGSKPTKKRNISETAHSNPGQPGNGASLLGQGIDPMHINQVPSRRSQSKNDKYKDQGDISNGLGGLGNFGPGGKLAQNQVRTSQQNQRFTPMNMTGKNGGPGGLTTQVM